MASQIRFEQDGAFDKPGRIPKNQGKKKWLKTRTEFLRQHLNWKGEWDCWGCGISTSRPEVDHIKKRSTHPQLVHHVDNLRIYCDLCHRNRHMEDK